MNDVPQFLTIAELSRLSGASARTLRTYFDLGLLPPPLTLLGNRRAWPAEMRDELLARVRELYVPGKYGPRGRRRRRRAASAASAAGGAQ